MKVSIITTCYNRAQTVGEAMASVLSQDYADVEYIVVDGASSDGSVERIRAAMAGHEAQVTFLSEPDHGMYEAINKGLRLATGDIVGLLHSDDFLYDRNTLRDIADTFAQTQADIVYGNGLFVDEADTAKVVRNWVSGPYRRGRVRRGWLPLHPTVYVRRSCLEQHGLYDESYKIAADSDFLVRYLYEATDVKVVYLNRYIVRMRMGGLSTDRRRMRQKWAEDLRMYRSHGFPPCATLLMKIASKVPQFIAARRMNRKT